MNSLIDYFKTDFDAMTTSDWVGTVLTLVVFLLMLGLYVYVLHPKRRDHFEKQKYIPMDDEQKNSGDNNGG